MHCRVRTKRSINLKLRNRSILALKCTFLGQNLLNIVDARVYTSYYFHGNFFFEFGNCRKFKLFSQYFNFLLNKLNFSGKNYSREKTV